MFRRNRKQDQVQDQEPPAAEAAATDTADVGQEAAVRLEFPEPPSGTVYRANKDALITVPWLNGRFHVKDGRVYAAHPVVALKPELFTAEHGDQGAEPQKWRPLVRPPERRDDTTAALVTVACQVEGCGYLDEVPYTPGMDVGAVLARHVCSVERDAWVAEYSDEALRAALEAGQPYAPPGVGSDTVTVVPGWNIASREDREMFDDPAELLAAKREQAQRENARRIGDRDPNWTTSQVKGVQVGAPEVSPL